MSSVHTWDSDFDIEEVFQYIKTVELAPSSVAHPQRGSVKAVPGSVAYVNRASIMYLPVPGQATTDSLNWTLFGQLAADAKFDRNANPIGWYQEYVKTLGRIGMRVNGWNRNSAAGADAGTSVDSTALRFLRPFLSVDAQGKIDGILYALRQSANSKPLSLFNKSASSSSSANFQVSDGTVDNGGNVTIHTGFMDFQANQRMANFLFFKWINRNFTLYYASDSMTLPRNIADRVRSAVEDRLVDRILENIMTIELA